MDLTPEAQKELAKELAYHLSWEFWMTDHAKAAQVALKKIYEEREIHDQPTLVLAHELWAGLRSYWKKYFKERRMDTVAVGISKDGKRIVIAANIKKRTEQGIRKPLKGEFVNNEFGLHDGRHDAAVRESFATFEQTRECIVDVLMPKRLPQSKEENGRLHAEMQIVNYMRNSDLELGVVGISKVACADCKRVLDEHRIDHVYNEDGHLSFPEGPMKGQAFANWADPTSEDFGAIERIRIERRQCRRIRHVTL
jgi:hypothetical protein